MFDLFFLVFCVHAPLFFVQTEVHLCIIRFCSYFFVYCARTQVLSSFLFVVRSPHTFAQFNSSCNASNILFVFSLMVCVRTAHVSFGFCEHIIFFSPIIDLLCVWVFFGNFYSLFFVVITLVLFLLVVAMVVAMMMIVL